MNKIINHKNMGTVSTSKWSKVGNSLLHVTIYVALLTLISTVASAQCANVSLACNSAINISTNESCVADITLDLIQQGNPAGFTDADYTIALLYADDTVFDTATGTGSITVGDSEVGTTFKATVTLDQCGITCWGNVTIEDKVGPIFIECDGTLDVGLHDAVVPCDGGFNIQEPVVAVGCEANSEVTFEDEDLGVTCTGDFSGEVIRTWYVSDSRGNQTSCRQRLLLEKFDIADVVFPDDFIFEINAIDCSNIPSIEPENTGEPTGTNCPNIMFFHTDIGAETCGEQIKLIRDWFVIDWCTGESISDGQVIKIRDLSPPVSSCPVDRTIDGSRFVTRTTSGSLFDTLFVQSRTFDCTAEVILDPMGIVDSLTTPLVVLDCSYPVTVDVAFKRAEPGVTDLGAIPFTDIEVADDGRYPIPGVVEDITWVRYCFTDACGNGPELQSNPNAVEADFVNCCFFEIRVSDNNPPNAICEGFTKIPVGPGGQTDVPAETFDDHSFDPCGSVMQFEARRESPGCGTNNFYDSSVAFCCEDVGDTISVFLRVTDADGNFSECPTRVCVTDDFIPDFSCPQDVTLSCLDDFTDLSTATGTVGCSTSFSIDNGTFDLSKFDTGCNTGTITRKILIRDLDGMIMDSCEQTITIMPSGTSMTLDADDFDFPDDVVIDICDADFSIDPSQTGLPTTVADFECINIGISYEDSAPITSNTAGECYTIIRNWIVVDWCRFSSTNPNEFVIRRTQNIEVRNSGTPELICPDMVMVSTDSINCIGFIDLAPTVNDACVGSELTWSIDAFTDGTVDITGSGIASGEYPAGEHSITFNIENSCGAGNDSCTFPFIIKGDRPPLPICLATITWTLNEDGEALVWASDFDLKSEGGCDGLDSLTITFDSPEAASYPTLERTFTCDDIANGISEIITLSVFITDESGAFESCTVNLDLQDTNDVCDNMDGMLTTIAGNISTETEQAIENVMVQLDNMNSVSPVMDMTGQSGEYAFNYVNFNQDYIVAPEYDEEHLKGISTLDLIQIQRHILGVERLDSPYKVIAADINKDNKVDGIDLVELRKLILGLYTELPQNDSYVFVSDSYQFTDMNSPWGYSDKITKMSVSSADMEADFTAVKVGDVNNDADLLQSSALDSRSAPAYVSGQNLQFDAGDLVAVPFRLEEAMQFDGFQFTLDFDTNALVFQGVDADAIPLREKNFALLNEPLGTMTFSHHDISGYKMDAGSNLFTIYFEAQTAGQLSDFVTLTGDVARPEFYTGADARSLNYIFRSESVSDSFEVFQNKPNPFTDFTKVAFYTPTRQSVNLTVYNVAGEVIQRQTGAFDKGINEFNIEISGLESEGLLIYRVETEDVSITKKMILFR